MTCTRCGSDDLSMGRVTTEPYEWTVICGFCGLVWHPTNKQLEETHGPA